MEVEHTVTRFVISVEELAALRTQPEALKSLVQGAVGQINGGRQVVVDHKPMPAERLLPSASGLTYSNCKRCGQEICDRRMKVHQRSQTCKRGRAKYQAFLEGR